MPDRNWNHAGIGRIGDGDSRYVKIPEMVRDRGILTPELPVFWSYEKVVGVVAVSDSELESSDYETVGYRKLSGEDNSFSSVVPSKFFEDHQGQGGRAVATPVPESARFEPGERVHFMFRDEMAKSDPSSCYVFTDEEFGERFKDSDTWNGKLDDVPRFL